MSYFSPEYIRTELSGTVYPVLTAFTEEGDLDLVAVKRYVDFLVSSGASSVMTTVGTSRFNLLSNCEIEEVNQAVADACHGRAIVIVAGPLTGSLRGNIELAQHAESAGADAYIAYYPDRWYGPEAIYSFFSELAASVSIGVMIHETPITSGYGGQVHYPIDLLERLIDIPNIVGMKEECMDAAYAYKLHRRLQGRCGIIGAGAMRNFLRDYHAGACANLAGIGSFFPRVEKAFHESIMSGDIEYAHTIVRRYEDPYFDVAVELGWHPQLKETLYLMGLMPPYERAPMPRLKEEQRIRLRKCIERLGWMDMNPDHVPERGNG